MTNKLHCPFCGAELVDEGAKIGNEGRYFACENLDCDLCGEPFGLQIWQALIDGKKAQDALKGIKIRVAAIRSCVQDGYTQLGERNRNIFIALELFKDLTKEITSITKGKDNDLGTVD